MLKFLTLSEYLGEIFTQKQVKIILKNLTDIFPIRTRSIRYKYQSCSTGIRYKPETGIKP